jgi:RHS repeat-associated protein
MAEDAAGNLNNRTNNALIQGFHVNSLNELTTTTNAGKLTVAGTTTSPATNVTVHPVRYEIPLCLCAAELEGWPLLHGIHRRFEAAVRRTSERSCGVQQEPSASGVDLLRGMPYTGRRHTSGEIPEDGVGETLFETAIAGLSHGVNTSNAVLYADTTFASTNQSWSSGNNTFTAIAKDASGRISTSSLTVKIESTNSYAYDLNGNLLSDGTRYFAYDDENQLISVTVSNAWQSQFVYDGKMRRRIERDYNWSGSSWTETNEIHYLYDGNVVIQERDINNLPKVTYTRGNDLSGTLQGAGGIGGLLARSDNTQMIIGSSSAHAFYHADGNGNVTMLINNSQSIVAKYLYDPFGNTLALSGSLASANTYRFSSKEWNDNAGLYYYLYRFYDPNLQRWPNRDPINEVGGLNLYEFIGNQPIAVVDLFGLCPVTQNCQDDYDAAIKAANQANLNCLASAIEHGIVGEVILGGGGVVVGVIIGRAPGAGVGLVAGTGANLLIDFAHLHECETKVDKMKQDALAAYKNCLKQNPNQATQE